MAWGRPVDEPLCEPEMCRKGGGGYSVRFRMLSTVRRLETLQRAKKEDRKSTFLPDFYKKIGGEIRHFPIFSQKIGVETMHFFPEAWKRGSKWRSIWSNLHIVSTPPPPRIWINEYCLISPCVFLSECKWGFSWKAPKACWPGCWPL